MEDFGNNFDNNKKKTTRVRISLENTEYLSRFFERKTRPSPKEKTEIAQKLGMSQRSVQVWFQNRRAKQKKEKETTDSPLMYKGNGIYPNSISPHNNSLYIPRGYTQSLKPFSKNFEFNTAFEGYYNDYLFGNEDAEFNIDQNILYDPNFFLSRSYSSKNNKVFKFHDCTNDQSYFKKKKKK